MASYYDKVLEDFGEGLLDDAYDEGFDDSYDEGALDEARGKKRPTPKIPGSVGRAANFGKNVGSTAGSGNFVTKAELKSSLNSISEQVNDLKKSSLSLASSVKKLDEGNDKMLRSIAKKDKAQDGVMNNSVMMTMLGTLINKPQLNPSALTIIDTSKPGTTTTLAIQDTPAAETAVTIDPLKSMLFAMMPLMMNGSSSGGGDNNMMMMMMVLLLGGNGSSGSGSSLFGGSSGDNTLVLVMMMMMMMNKK